MNLKTRFVLLFAKLRKPINPDSQNGIRQLRKKSAASAALGTRLFDSHVRVFNVNNVTADGVRVRIYQSSSHKSQRVLVYYHGGGFVLYGLNSHDNVCRRLCRMNDCIVVSVDYRRAPEHTFPAAHEDAFTALQWVRKNIRQYGGDSENLVVIGDSAGGNLAACMAHRCRKEGITLRAQVLIYPWIDGKLENPSLTKNGKGYLLEKETVFWFRQQYTPRPEDRCHPLVSPKYENDFTGLAPAFVLTAQFDPLLDDGYNYSKQLEEGGNAVTYKEYPQTIHGFFNIPFISDHAFSAYEDISQYLKEV